MADEPKSCCTYLSTEEKFACDVLPVQNNTGIGVQVCPYSRQQIEIAPLPNEVSPYVDNFVFDEGHWLEANYVPTLPG